MAQQTTSVQAPAQAAAAALSGYTKDEILSAVPAECSTPAVPLRVSLREAFESEPREVIIDAALLAGGKGVDPRWLPASPEVDAAKGTQRHYLTTPRDGYVDRERALGCGTQPKVNASVYRFLNGEPERVWIHLGLGSFDCMQSMPANDAYAFGIALIQAARAAQVAELKQFLTGEPADVASTDPVEA